MLLTSISLCCLILNVQSQTSSLYSPYWNPDFIYFSDNLPQVVPLSVPNPNTIDQNVIRNIFDNNSQKKTIPKTTVEIEKSKEIAFGSSVDPVPNENKQNIVNRQISSPRTPSIETAQQIALDRQIQPQFLVQRQPLPQTSFNRPNVPETQFIGPPAQETSQNRPLPFERPTLSQASHDRPTLQQNTLGGPPLSQAQTPNAVGLNVPANPGFNSLLYSVTNFGLNLMKNIDGVHSGNIVISPYSIDSLLALLQQGARGQTQEQLTNALQMTPTASASAYGQIFEDFKTRNSRNILKTANNLFVADAFALNRDFKNIAQRSFSSDITPLNYARPEEAARQINSWVASRTDNKIERLIAPDSLTPTTQIVLVNAIYFKGLWDVPFRLESTIPREFQLSNGQTKTAQFMRIRKMFRTGTDPTTNAKVILLPFEREQYYLMVILPSQLASMSSTLSSLTDARLLSYLSFSAADTELELPKFTARADTDLKAVLQKMGITNIFGRLAELNGVGQYRAYSPQVTSAVHSAVLSVDEQGASAAAATAFAAVALSYDDPTVIFKADRPFIAVLWDSKSSLPLFMAKIENPQQ